MDGRLPLGQLLEVERRRSGTFNQLSKRPGPSFSMREVWPDTHAKPQGGLQASQRTAPFS